MSSNEYWPAAVPAGTVLVTAKPAEAPGASSAGGGATENQRAGVWPTGSTLAAARTGRPVLLTAVNSALAWPALSTTGADGITTSKAVPDVRRLITPHLSAG